MVKKPDLAKFKFITSISRMGEDRRMIWIPKKYHGEIEEFLGKQIRVVIDDEF